MTNVLLFDLDGTLTESGTGIIRSVQYALEKFGITETNEEVLRRFVGPPLIDSFMRYYNFTKEDAVKGVAIYRERFGTIGIFENELYPGAKEMLQELKEAGFLLSVASSKPEHYVLQILDHFKIAEFFDEVVGATMDEKRTSKPEIIEEVIFRLKLSDRRDEVLMVGDTEHDIIGAGEHGIECVAVTYGYGDPEKMKQARPLVMLDSVEELKSYLLNIKR